jgi:hypothetical protein
VHYSGLIFHFQLLPDEEPVKFPMFKNLTTLMLDDCELGDKFQLAALSAEFA